MKLTLFLLTLIPWIWGVGDIINAIDPYDVSLRFTGTWMVVWLSIVLIIGPLGRFLKNPRVTWCRQPLGISIGIYAVSHILFYLVLSPKFDIALISIVNKPFLLVGAVGAILLLSLSITSNQYSIKKLGKNWKTLHSSATLAAALGVAHSLFSQKTVFTDVGITSTILLGILLSRTLLEIRK